MQPTRQLIPHQHNFWQTNWVKSGECIFRAGGRRYILREGDLIFIAPGVSHSFQYPGSFLCYSFKFSGEVFAGSDIIHLNASAFTRGVIRAADALVQSGFPGERIGDPQEAIIMDHDRYHHILEHLIAGVLESSFGDRKYPSGPAGLVRKLLLQSRGAPLDVAEAARAGGYSRNHFSLLVKELTGLTAKELIDRERLDIAKRYLEYTDKTIGEVAELMGFPSQFYFSRFFRRLTGCSPKDYRFKLMKKDSGTSS